MLLLGSLRDLVPEVVGSMGLSLAVAGLGWGLLKVFAFRYLARGERAARRSEAWWVPIS